jgi:hypothetical protein
MRMSRFLDELIAPEMIFTITSGNSFCKVIHEHERGARAGQPTHTIRAPTQPSALSEVTGSLILGRLSYGFNRFYSGFN